MAYWPSTPYGKNPSQAIWVYATPLKHDFINGSLKKPVTLFAHWAVCIDGVCYELRAGEKDKGEKEKFLYKSIPLRDWIVKRNYSGEPKCAGYMSQPYPSWAIDETAKLVWTKTFQGKYSFDKRNCQAFIRLLAELIGDADAKVNLPHFFDEWMTKASVTRDATILGLASGMALMGVGLVTAGVDMGATAAAGFGIAGTTVISSATALFNLRDMESKRIKKAQKEIREEMLARYGITLV